jgi:hypothetical protein
MILSQTLGLKSLIIEMKGHGVWVYFVHIYLQFQR